MSVDDFNYLTPYELALALEVYLEKSEAELKERLTLVWLGEYYHRTKRMPNLKDELKKISGKNNKPEMSDFEMLQVVKRLNQQFGGTYKNGGE